jgi:hypothetical protein
MSLSRVIVPFSSFPSISNLYMKLYLQEIEILDFLSLSRKKLMNHSPDDPDEFARKKIDQNHIINISKFE